MALTVFQIRRDVIAALRRRTPRIHREFEMLVAGLRANPRLFFAKPNVETFITYLQGYDAALHGVPLDGFLYWLELKWNPDGNPQHWVNALPLAARRQAGASKSQVRVLDAACAVLQKFFSYRRRYGTADLTRKYLARRQRQIAHRARQAGTAGEAPSNKSLKRTRGR
jgi:hypothetical protein